jgi:hypothetical protein
MRGATGEPSAGFAARGYREIRSSWFSPQRGGRVVLIGEVAHGWRSLGVSLSKRAAFDSSPDSPRRNRLLPA